MSSLTVTVSGKSGSTAAANWRYYTDGTTRYREGVRDGKYVVDKYLAGGDLDKFNSGEGTEGTDYELVDQLS